MGDDAPTAAPLIPPSPSGGGPGASGWYPDPFGQVPQRYWDGTRWLPFGSLDGTDMQVFRDGSLPDPALTRPASRRALAVVATVAAIALAVGASFLFASDSGEDASMLPAQGTSPGPTAVDEAPATTLPVTAPPTTSSEPMDLGGALFAEPLKVVYEVETNNGERYEEVVATDGVRSIRRGQDTVLYHDEEDRIGCFDGRCTRQGPSKGGDHLRAFVRTPPSADEDTSGREIAGRRAVCRAMSGGMTECWDAETFLVLLSDPGEDAMQPSAFTSSRRTATYVGAPEESDFELPAEPVPLEDR